MGNDDTDANSDDDAGRNGDENDGYWMVRQWRGGDSDDGGELWPGQQK